MLIKLPRNNLYLENIPKIQFAERETCFSVDISCLMNGNSCLVLRTRVSLSAQCADPKVAIHLHLSACQTQVVKALINIELTPNYILYYI